MSTHPSRRTFFKAGVTLAAAALFPPALVWGKPNAGKPLPQIAGAFTRSNLNSYVGQEFAVTQGQSGRPFWLRLEAVVGKPSRDPQIDCFNLLFTGSGEPPASGIHSFYHSQAGAFDLYIEALADGKPGDYGIASFALLA